MATKRSGKLASRYAKALIRATREMVEESGATNPTLEMANALSGFAEVWKNSYKQSTPMTSTDPSN